jgi:hypothetical protein
MGAGGAAAATLWRMPPSLFEDPAGTQRAPRRYGGGDDADDDEEEDDYARSASSQHASSSSLPEPPRLEALARLEGSSPSSEIVDAAWGDPSDEPGSSSSRSDAGGVVVTLERGGVVTRWDAAAGRPVSSRQAAGGGGGGSSSSLFPPRVALDPHSPGGGGGAVAVSRGPSVRVVDWRAGPGSGAAGERAATVVRAHPGSAVTGLDYNPNRPNVLATSGQDGLIKVCVAQWRLFRSCRGSFRRCGGLSSHP